MDYFARTHNMNLYQGCTHGCIYCDSRSVCYQIADFDQIRAKSNALPILEKELSQKRSRGIIGTGAMSDPYNSFETQLQLTRGALQLLDKYRFGVSITTKSASIINDIDLYERIARHSAVDIGLTVTTLDDALAAKIEPYVSSPTERMEALKQMADSGLFCGVHLNPVLPFITDSMENILSVVRTVAACGGRYVLCYFGVTMRQGNREYYYAKLDEQFPGVKAKYIRTFGNAYVCASPRAQALYETFTNECRRLGLVYRVADISDNIRASAAQQQLRMF